MACRFIWVPESPKFPGVYATEKGGSNCTHSLHEARQFAVKEECEFWCIMNPKPPFVAKEHGIVENRND